MNRLGKWWLAVGGAAVLATVIGAGAVMAQTPVTGGATGTTFLARVAAKLGIDTSTLETAIKDTKTDDIDARVASGDLTQAQADEMKQRIADAPADAPFFGGGDHGRGPGGPGGPVDQEKLATFLGTDAATLRTELSATDATLATVAAAHGKSRDELKAFLTDEAKTRIAQEVTDGHITQAQADTKLADLATNLDTRIDAVGGFGHGPGGPGGPGGFGGHGPGDFGAPGDMPAPDSTTPGATTTPTN